MKRSVILALSCAVLLCGCDFPARSRAVDQLLPVETLGFDVSGGEVIVSASAGGRRTGERGTALAARGGSIPRAMENLRGWSAAQELFFAHVRYAVIGEEAARAGLGPVLDYFARSTQTSLELPLAVVRGGEARALVTGNADGDYEITALLDSARRDAELTGTARFFTMRQIAQRLNRSGAALCCAVRAGSTGENAPSAEAGTQAVLCDGYAVLKNGALAGFLDRATALGADLLLGLAGQAECILPGEGGSVTVTLLDSGAELSPLYTEAGDLVLLVTLRLRAGVLEADGTPVTDPAVRRALAEALGRAAAAGAEAALAASRDMGADFLELYRVMARKAPGALSGTTPEAFVRSLRWQIRPEAVLERSYDLDGEPHG
jgi:hypothetical protein